MKPDTRLATQNDLPALAQLFDSYRQFYEQAPDLAGATAFINLTTARTNLAAQALYTSLGWVQDEVFLTFNRHLPAVPPSAQS